MSLLCEIRMGDYTFVLLARGQKSEGARRRIPDRGAARRLLRRLIKQPSAVVKLRRLLRRAGGPATHRSNELIRRLSWHLATGSVRVLRRDTLLRPLEPPKAPEPIEPTETKKAEEEEPAWDLALRLAIDPDDAGNFGDTFVLVGGESATARDYEQKHTASDEHGRGDDWIEVLFTDLVPHVSYWLEVEPDGGGDKYFVFEKLGWTGIQGMAIEK